MLLRKFVLIIFLIGGSNCASAQLTQPQLDSLVNRYVQNLRKQKVDTICIYNEYCVGCLFDPVTGNNLCTDQFHSLPTYIFWKSNGKTLATRKDICFDYSTVPITVDTFSNYYFANKEKIKREKLKQPQYYDNDNGKKILQTVNIDNSIYFTITIITKEETLTKEINSFFFTRELGEDGFININFDYNNQTALNGVHQRLGTITRNESIRKRFIKTPR